ncbi:AAA family ATPase [Psychrobacter sp. Ps1]|uniref:McrB family protein n=1 Tax=Psychrobacter sp. Ps1 TaxID=2790955 RepID=UPI001EE08D47|nr:AAA family ATPase [Psychrobacter sp. Ps1]MCG3843446.1 AAA family ATPase [Psychrobacter sp. Ps1]
MQQIIVKDGDYNCPPPINKQDWIEILSDDSFMSNNYKFALSIFYLEPDHKATCKYLAEKYHTHPTSISGFVTQFSARLQGKLNRFEVIKEDGSPNWWLITMTGKKVAGGLFEWRLRDELIEAMIDLDFIDSSQLEIDSLDALVKFINEDLSEFIIGFRKTRKFLSNKERATTSGILFKYKGDDADWAINEGGHNEIQYHIFLRDSEVGYGLGFNAQYVPFSNDKTSLEFARPFVDSFLSIQNSDIVETLRNRGFEIDLISLKSMAEGEYNLFGRVVPLVDGKLPLIDYYSIINDLKGNVFELYKQIFEFANELTTNNQPSDQNHQPPITNPLLQEISELLLANKNIVLTGAPGTGKTYLAKTLAEEWGAEYELIQFHPSYDYTDFVEGLRPIQNENGEVGFELRDGSFKKFCKEARKYQNNQQLSNFEEVYQRFIDDISESAIDLVTPSQGSPFTIIVNTRENITAVLSSETQRQITLTKSLIQNYFETGKALNWKPYLIPVCEYIKKNYDLTLTNTDNQNKKFIIILDEINRAEISKVLGELFFSIDPGYRGESGRVTTQYANLQTDEDVFKEGFYIPDNVYIIGTMNDIDRSVESFDFAMRRRFAWKEIKSADRLSMWEGQIDDWAEEAEQRLMDLNKAIESVQGLNSAYHVGPSYFLKLANYDGDFDKLWTYHLESLLFEYLRGYPNAEQQIQGLKDAYNLQLGFDDDRNDG